MYTLIHLYTYTLQKPLYPCRVKKYLARWLGGWEYTSLSY